MFVVYNVDCPCVSLSAGTEVGMNCMQPTLLQGTGLALHKSHALPYLHHSHMHPLLCSSSWSLI